MAREGRDLIKIILRNFINSLKPKKFSGTLVGSDHLGNKYYKNCGSSSRHDARWFVPPGGDEDKFDQSLPTEWESWLRKRRKDPPTEEEINANLELIKSKQSKASAIEKKFKPSIAPGELRKFPKREGYEIYPGKKPD